MPHIDDDLEQREAASGQCQICPEELEKTNFRVLSVSEKMVLKTMIIEPQARLELIFFRVVFTRLRKQYCSMQSDQQSEEESVPFEAFQRVFERLFFLLADGRVFDGREYDEKGDEGRSAVTWGRFFHVYKREEGVVTKLSLCERIYFTFDNPDSSYLAQIISVVVLLTIMLSSFCFIISTVDECQVAPEGGGRPKPASVFQKIEAGCLLLFVVEYVARLSTCWNIRSYILDQAKLQDIILGHEPITLPTALDKVMNFVIAPSNIIDLAAILPGVISLILQQEGGGGLVVLRLVRLTRIFRAFKNPAINEPVMVLGKTLSESTKALYVLAFQLTLLIVVSGSLMWVAEQGRWESSTRTYHRRVKQEWNNIDHAWRDIYEESPFQSIPHAFWWAIVTATTVGYGDHYPVTSWGYIVAVVTMVVSLVITALPVGVIGGTFSNVWASMIEARKLERAERRSEMEHITKAIQTLDPTRMSTLLFVQVWNNPAHKEGSAAPSPSAVHFMGEALLELPLDSEPLLRQEELRLVDNNDLVKRSVKGKITLRYEWTPQRARLLKAKDSKSSLEAPTMKEVDGRLESGLLKRHQSAMPYRLEGDLAVTVVSAEGLVNLDGCKRNGVSSPYCVVYVYPQAPCEGDPVCPEVWRYPTAAANLSPRWEAQHSFHYNWDLSRSNPKRWSDSHASGNDVEPPCAAIDSDEGEQTSPIALIDVTGSALHAAPKCAMHKALGQLEEFCAGLRQVNQDLQKLESDVGRLVDGDASRPELPGLRLIAADTGRPEQPSPDHFSTAEFGTVTQRVAEPEQSAVEEPASALAISTSGTAESVQLPGSVPG